MNKYKKIRINANLVIDEHRHVMQIFLKRKLLFNEVVHHINGNKQDNSIENLELMSRSEHILHHIKMGDIRPSNHNSKLLCEVNSKLSYKDACYVCNSKEKNCDLAKKFNVSKFVISRAKRGVTWKHILRGGAVVSALDS